MKQTFISYNPQDTQRFAARVARRLKPPAIIALEGNPGSGKTEFVKGLAIALGIKQTIQSPTFVLHKSYPFHHGGRRGRLDHLDLYRLRTRRSLAELNLDELLADLNRIVVIEWPQKFKKFLQSQTVVIRFRYGKKTNQRTITSSQNF